MSLATALMPTEFIPEPHPIVRLKERYGISIDCRQLVALNRLLCDPISRQDRTLLRYASSRPGRYEMWLVNLLSVVGLERWALAGFDREYGRINTFYPDPGTSDSRRVSWMLSTTGIWNKP